ncbi:hypothetical protein R3W88_011851 [Solanum pinnatisectum]|uniref:Reverse transcriptase zinc-binding domain-containing protein n=1 Tax=Solanum pinnatisectum TaxID=50273 RepID=A0AAV9L8N1_9SOLN|nr:hypothetical protein R3W88_011851 [Solanum pinnatisectum]
MNGVWDSSKLKEHISKEMANHIIENIKPQINEDITDKAWWTGDNKGRFTVKSAFNNVRRRRMEQEWVQEIWIKGLPFKIDFFHWRVWKRRIATDDNLKRMRLQVVSKCYCCEHGEMETMTHLLLTAPIAQRLWKQFASCAGLNIEGMHLQQIITAWWEHKASHKLTQILKAIPAIIMWALWKRRNTRRHGKDHSFNWMNHHCQETIHQLIRVKFPWPKKVPYQWMEIVDMLQRYKPTLHYHIVNWKLPEEGRIKCNTDGASKGNPGHSAYEFCMRNNNGDLVYAEGGDIGWLPIWKRKQ